MSVTVDIPYDRVREATKGIEDYVQKIYEGRRYQIAEAFIDVVTPFVPVKHGYLRESATIVDSGHSVQWSAINPKTGYDYAGMQYETTWFEHPRGGYAEWDDIAMKYEGDTFIERVKDILER